MTEPEDFDHRNGGRNPYRPIFDVEGNLVDPADTSEAAERPESRPAPSVGDEGMRDEPIVADDRPDEARGRVSDDALSESLAEHRHDERVTHEQVTPDQQVGAGSVPTGERVPGRESPDEAVSRIEQAVPLAGPADDPVGDDPVHRAADSHEERDEDAALDDDDDDGWAQASTPSHDLHEAASAATADEPTPAHADRPAGEPAPMSDDEPRESRHDQPASAALSDEPEPDPVDRDRSAEPVVVPVVVQPAGDEQAPRHDRGPDEQRAPEPEAGRDAPPLDVPERDTSVGVADDRRLDADEMDERQANLGEADDADDPDRTHVFGSARTEPVSPYVARGLAEPTGNANLLYRDQRHDPFARPNVETDDTASAEAHDDPDHPREPDVDETAQLDEVQAQAEAERAELDRQAREEEERRYAEEAERAATERAARNRALGVVSPTGTEVAAPAAPTRHVTDKFFGSSGLFLLRMVVAAILGIRTFQLAINMDAFTETLTRTMIPYPEIAAWVAVISMGLVAVALLLGVLVRVAGFGLLALSVLSLVFLRWGPNPFVNGELGFVGELELVLAGVGMLFLSLGGGAWGLDGSYRRSRVRDKAAKA